MQGLFVELRKYTNGTLGSGSWSKLLKGADPQAPLSTGARQPRSIITYSSHRRLGALAKGIVRRIAGDLKERVAIKDSTCMHKVGPER
jgi:hypothetical protein